MNVCPRYNRVLCNLRDLSSRVRWERPRPMLPSLNQLLADVFNGVFYAWRPIQVECQGMLQSQICMCAPEICLCAAGAGLEASVLKILTIQGSTVDPKRFPTYGHRKYPWFKTIRFFQYEHPRWQIGKALRVQLCAWGQEASYARNLKMLHNQGESTEICTHQQCAVLLWCPRAKHLHHADGNILARTL